MQVDGVHSLKQMWIDHVVHGVDVLLEQTRQAVGGASANASTGMVDAVVGGYDAHSADAYDSDAYGADAYGADAYSACGVDVYGSCGVRLMCSFFFGEG